MSTTTPIDPQRRADIIDDIRNGKTRNATARDNAVAPSTVTRIANSENLTFDRAITEKATRARAADSKAAAAQLVADLLADAAALRHQIYRPVVYRQASAGKLVSWEQSTPTFADIQKIVTTCAIAVDKFVALEKVRYDDQALSDFDVWLQIISGQADDPREQVPTEPQEQTA